MTPYLVRREDVLAYEHRTGFVGIGEFLERRGKIMMTGKVKACLTVASE